MNNNPKRFINIFIGILILIVIIGIVTYFIFIRKQSESPSQQADINNGKTSSASSSYEPKNQFATTSQGKVKTSKTSEFGKPTLFFVKPKGTILRKPGELLSIELRGTNISDVVLVGPGFAKREKSDGTGIFTFQYRIPLGVIGPIKMRATGQKGDVALVQSDELIVKISR